MRLKAIQENFQQELPGIYSLEEINNLFFMLIEEYFEVNRLQLALNPNLEIDNPNLLNSSLQKLKKKTPIQYILGKTEFYGLSIKVNRNVLIPRPETEELVDWIVSDFKSNHETLKILDIGTGSGCIAISLAKNLINASVYAIDLSKEALSVAEENARINEVEIQFFNLDILNEPSWIAEFGNLEFDVIVSNPPYVREQEKSMIKANVLNYEPHGALFVKDSDPLLFYRKIIKFALMNLNKTGNIYFEINESIGLEMIELIESTSFKNIELRSDIFGKDRMIKATKI